MIFLEHIWTPYTLLFLASFVFSIFSPQFRNRRKMMLVKATGDGFGAAYLFCLGGTSGAYGALIASLGALTQACTPHHYHKITMWPRAILASLLSLICIYISYKTPLDILPLSMVIVCRFGELQSKAQHIRLVYFITCLPWIIYHIANGYYLPAGATILTFLSLFLSIWRHYRSQEPTSLDEQGAS